MKDGQDYYFIFSNFYNSILSLDKYVKEFVKSKDIFYSMKKNDSTGEITDEAKIEYIFSYLKYKQKYSGDEKKQKAIKNAEDKIKNDYKLNAFLKQVEFTDKGMTSNHPYIRMLIHNCNVENENIKNEVTQLKNNQIKNLISIFEGLVSNLFVYYFKYSNDPNLLNKENMEFKDLKYIEKIEDVRDYIIDKKVMKIMFDSFNNWLKKYCDFCIKSGYNSIDRDYKEYRYLINELFERRHLLTHNNGKINHIYLSKTDVKLNGDMNIGDELIVSNEYLDEAILAILEFGTILYTKSINVKEFVDKQKYLISLNSLGLDFLTNGYYKASEYIFQFLFNSSENKKGNGNDVYKYNIWLSKLLRNDKSCIIEIDRFFEHKDCNEDDELARSILLGKENYIHTIENFLAGASYSQVINILSWPIFLLLKNDDEFIELKGKYLYNEFKERVDLNDA
ncbi:hypothetical protein ACE3LZ_03170 [Staphylococcus saprophyticus]|uniref:hypothetical protein n=1 Tax=Staphylococcus saprophyticus TaxID=29385 RepID=UPI0009907DCA|nr:hypothetical protein [Staphylococcus saprophyticus]MBF2751510.1 hypothetical protein [Staphylococcus saprophyticus]MDW3894435.1 hypothetical protein [Staphylococcus saprophyticus]MDW4254615.1 hypothetical protein [Staphylococcus saprophyticus]OOO71613.1 hypothetical protein B0W56_06655 [Staphylococcus saprophyticus]